MNVITIQHTQSQHHLNQMVGSWTDWPLTEKGIAQAEIIVRKLAKIKQIENYHIYTSDFCRCQDIAKMLQENTGSPLTVTPKLRGKHYGQACGKSDAWLEAHRLPYLGYDARDIDYRYFEDAENTIDTYNRVKPFFEEILSAEQDIVLVGHGDILNLFYAHWLGLSIEMLRSVDIFTEPGSVSFFKMLPNKKRIALKIGDTSFMQQTEELL